MTKYHNTTTMLTLDFSSWRIILSQLSCDYRKFLSFQVYTSIISTTTTAGSTMTTPATTTPPVPTTGSLVTEILRPQAQSPTTALVGSMFNVQRQQLGLVGLFSFFAILLTNVYKQTIRTERGPQRHQVRRTVTTHNTTRRDDECQPDSSSRNAGTSLTPGMTNGHHHQIRDDMATITT